MESSSQEQKDKRNKLKTKYENLKEIDEKLKEIETKIQIYKNNQIDSIKTDIENDFDNLNINNSFSALKTRKEELKNKFRKIIENRTRKGKEVITNQLYEEGAENSPDVQINDESDSESETETEEISET